MLSVIRSTGNVSFVIKAEDMQSKLVANVEAVSSVSLVLVEVEVQKECLIIYCTCKPPTANNLIAWGEDCTTGKP